MTKPIAIIGLIVQYQLVLGAQPATDASSLRDRWIAMARAAQQQQRLGDPEAETALRDAVHQIEIELGPPDSMLADRLSKFAANIHAEGFSAEAYPLVSRAGEIAEGSGNRRLIGLVQARIGAVLVGMKQYARAEPLLRRSIALLKQTEGPGAFNTAVAENNLAVIYTDTDRLVEAELLQRSALPVYEKFAGDTPTYTSALANLYTILAGQRRAEEGAPYLLHAVAIAAKNFPASADAFRLQTCMASLEFNRGHVQEAAKLLRKIISLQEHALGPNHPDLAQTLECYSSVLRQLKNTAESKRVEARAQSILRANSFR